VASGCVRSLFFVLFSYFSKAALRDGLEVGGGSRSGGRVENPGHRSNSQEDGKKRYA